MYSYKKRIFEIIDRAKDNDVVSKMFDYIIMTLIILNTTSIILESFAHLAEKYQGVFYYLEVVSIIIFTIEYLLRFWTADLKFECKKSSFRSRIKYLFSFEALIDLIAILPFYLPMLIPFDLRVLRTLRLTRLFRLFKFNRYSKAMNLIGKVITDKKEELFATIFLMCFLILISSTLMHHFESEVQPDAFPNIVASFWWAVATLTTVGYGDIYPITSVGKLLATIIAILGIGLVALPTGIISSGFIDELTKKKDDDIRCPHCGKQINEDKDIA